MVIVVRNSLLNLIARFSSNGYTSSIKFAIIYCQVLEIIRNNRATEMKMIFKRNKMK
jgi:hypothetical protein